jgi:hydroxymethylbilane synthase
MKKTVKIGSRPSDLALRQVQLVIESLRPQFPETTFIVVPMRTTGDIRRDTLNLNVKDKKEWVIELEQQMVSGEIDFAIHSAKDVPLQLEPGTKITTVLKRIISSDVMLYTAHKDLPCPRSNLPMLPPGANVGTSSKRRRSQILRLRPDLCVTLCRGNVPTRIAKLRDDKMYDAIVIAGAGLERLGLHDNPLSYVFSPDEMLPAVGQGTLVAQYPGHNHEIESLLSKAVHTKTQIEYECERSFVHVLGADCHSSVGVFAKVRNNGISISGRVLSDDGFEYIEDTMEGDVVDSVSIGKKLGTSLMKKGASSLI